MRAVLCNVESKTAAHARRTARARPETRRRMRRMRLIEGRPELALIIIGERRGGTVLPPPRFSLITRSYQSSRTRPASLPVPLDGGHCTERPGGEGHTLQGPMPGTMPAGGGSRGGGEPRLLHAQLKAPWWSIRRMRRTPFTRWSHSLLAARRALFTATSWAHLHSCSPLLSSSEERRPRQVRSLNQGEAPRGRHYSTPRGGGACCLSLVDNIVTTCP
jgi:hypothetical protein